MSGEDRQHPMRASIPDCRRSRFLSAFLRLSTTSFANPRIEKNSYWMPRCLGGSKTKQLCRGELELRPPLHFLSHGKWECHQHWGAPVILRVCLWAPLFKMHLESSGCSPGMNWSDPSTRPTLVSKNLSVWNPRRVGSKSRVKRKIPGCSRLLPSNIINNMWDGAGGGQGKDASFTFIEVTLPFSALFRERFFFFSFLF